jgi:hypothetical protein
MVRRAGSLNNNKWRNHLQNNYFELHYLNQTILQRFAWELKKFDNLNVLNIWLSQYKFLYKYIISMKWRKLQPEMFLLRIKKKIMIKHNL